MTRPWTWLVLFIPLGATACSPPSGAPPDYDAMFITDRIVTWQITVGVDRWRKLLLDPTTYVEADLTVDKTRYARVGLRLMGTKRRPKRSLRIRFNAFEPWQRFHGVKRMNLRSTDSDPTLIRECLALTLMRRAGVPAPRCSMTWVSINENPGGIYTLVEQVDRRFLEDRFGDKDGNLYNLERGATLVDLGDDPDSYDPLVYELKSDQVAPDRSDLVHLIHVLNRGRADMLEQLLPRVLDVDGLLRALGVNTWLANMDAYPGTGDNLYLYRDTAGLFHYIPWDLNRAFGNYHGPSCPYTTDQLLRLPADRPTCGGERPLVDRLLAVPGLLTRYLGSLRELTVGVLHPDAVRTQADALRRVVETRVQLDLLKDFSNEQFERSFTSDIPEGDNPSRVPGLIPFIEQRHKLLSGG